MRLNPLTCIDFYKADHRRQYPDGTEMVYSNFTARSAKLKNIPDHLFNGHTTFFGLQFFIKDFLIETWNEGFFNRQLTDVVTEYRARMDCALGKDAIPVDHIEALHKLGFLPIAIQALPEGASVPIKVPSLIIYNTRPQFFWLTNYLETVMSAYLWKPTTSATMAFHYRSLLEAYAVKTGVDKAFVSFQGHDFSFRGMSCVHDAALSGAAHLTSFCGTDTIPAIDLVEQYYGAKPASELVGVSVPATEHSVMCMGTKDDEVRTFRRLVAELYPKGIVSIVSDTWDFWKVITEYAATLKPEIMARDGKVVFRPDSGDPVKIICGDPNSDAGSPAQFGAVECLWKIFGGRVNEAGYKMLDPHVGLIYGDSITLERAEAILQGLQAKGFASSNIVFGVGSYTYQFVTRDTFGFAVKSTYGIVNGEDREIFKDPVTDSGVKKSARGLIKVTMENGDYVLHDQQDAILIDGENCLREVFRDGELLIEEALEDIRRRVRACKWR